MNELERMSEEEGYLGKARFTEDESRLIDAAIDVGGQFAVVSETTEGCMRLIAICALEEFAVALAKVLQASAVEYQQSLLPGEVSEIGVVDFLVADLSQFFRNLH